MTAVTTTTVITAIMSFTVIMTVVVAHYVGIVIQFAFQKSFHCRICVSAYTAVEFDAGLRQSHLCTTADAAAN